jgi:hypothetical protein
MAAMWAIITVYPSGGADLAACAPAVVGQNLLSQSFREPLADDAADDVGAAARREADDHADRPRGIRLRGGGTTKRNPNKNQDGETQ